ncbi:tapasin-related protein-like isoform X3 [Ascaphus truei]|uniref:tapasin-related protein-like isoform X3 n=1 Tax=Ascaphus truei TaxID=8439 RepID=UPI003F599832
MDSKLFFLILCMVIYGNQTFEDVTFRESKKLPCLFEKRHTSENSQWVENKELTQLGAWLVLGSKSGSVQESFDSEGVRFILKDSSMTLMSFLDNDADMLVCAIKSYFTNNIQILWPGIQTNNIVDLWFICTFKHIEGNFEVTTFLTQLPGRPLVEENLQPHVSQDADTLYVLAVFTLSTQTPLIRTRLRKDVLLDCAFSVDHQADVTVTWSLKMQGGQEKRLLSYNGSTKEVEYHIKGVEMLVEEIPKGNASLLLRNVAVENQGLYSCSISVSSLYGDQKIRLEVIESPTVTINVASLSLVEGQEEKLVCDASYYYPLDVHIEWLREHQSKKFMPTVVKNVLFNSHKNNGDGTYSLSGFFMLTGSLQDDGVMFTCRVEHTSLKKPIRKSVRVTVAESTKWSYGDWLLIMLIATLSVLLLYMFKYLRTVKSSSKEAILRSACGRTVSIPAMALVTASCATSVHQIHFSPALIRLIEL